MSTLQEKVDKTLFNKLISSLRQIIAPGFALGYYLTKGFSISKLSTFLG